MILVDTFVAGQPKTKGSVTVRKNGTVTNSRKRADGTMDHSSSHWRALMAGAVRDDYARRFGSLTTAAPCVGPVMVSLLAHLPTDPLAYGAGDLDKLLRNVLDALGTTSKNPRFNGGVIVDDNQVTRIDATKYGPTLQPGVHILVTALQ